MSERVRTAGEFDWRAVVVDHAKGAGLPLWRLFKVAGVSWETWRRWNAGEAEPNLGTIKKLLAVPLASGTPARPAQ